MVVPQKAYQGCEKLHQGSNEVAIRMTKGSNEVLTR